MNTHDTTLPTPSTRTTARVVGTLFLAAFLLYGVGNAIASNSTQGDGMLVLGVGMMLANSFAVLTIGVLLVPILRPHSPAVAKIYLATRIFEAAFLAAGAIALLVGSAAVNVVAYNTAMAGLGIGSLFFTVVLYRSRLVPRFLAAWGFVGYAAFATGSLLELAGVSGAGLIGAAPGGLFEIVFALWLLVRGFTTTDGTTS
ncbi:DUF4386 domain-containing protein [Microcella sp.]|uniref:DUF4386 domain-containing protein n=1 Tax=Microcella sp. TaxID=1913979 RepID=UPI00391975DB